MESLRVPFFICIFAICKLKKNKIMEFNDEMRWAFIGLVLTFNITVIYIYVIPGLQELWGMYKDYRKLKKELKK
jgi:hypothetical protein